MVAITDAVAAPTAILCSPKQVKQCSANAAAQTFHYADLVIEQSKHRSSPVAPQDIRFGYNFTDHMLVVEHIDGHWGAPKIQPLGMLQIHPASPVLHYGMGCFEGMKAYLGPDGVGRLFRPEKNAQRLLRSVQRLALAPFDALELVECLKALVRIDQAHIPSAHNFSLYLRPLVYGSGHSLGVHKSDRTTLCIMMCPVGPFFTEGVSKPVSLAVDESNVRAWPGGVGAFKLGGNYAPTINVQEDHAKALGTQQVLYTLPCGPDPDQATISEAGAMNVFVLFAHPNGGKAELATPPLDNTILPGVTRDSILALTRQWGEFDVTERAITVGELKQASVDGRLQAVFGVGTAVIVLPVGRLVRQSGDEAYNISFAPGSPGQLLTSRLLRELQDIQFGRVDHAWSVSVES